MEVFMSKKQRFSLSHDIRKRKKKGPPIDSGDTQKITIRFDSLLVILYVLVTAIKDLLTDIIAGHIQEHFRLITETGWFWVVVVIFMLALISCFYIARRQR
jgi:hypothetical protein